MQKFGVGAMQQYSRREKLRVVLLRNFLVVTYRNPAGIRQKKKKWGIYWFSESKNNQTEGRKGKLLGFRDKWDTGHKSPGALCIPSLDGLSLGGFLSFRFCSFTIDHPYALGSIMALKYN